MKHALIDRSPAADNPHVLALTYGVVPSDAPDTEFCLPCGGEATTNEQCSCNPAFVARMGEIAADFKETEEYKAWDARNRAQ